MNNVRLLLIQFVQCLGQAAWLFLWLVVVSVSHCSGESADRRFVSLQQTNYSTPQIYIKISETHKENALFLLFVPYFSLFAGFPVNVSQIDWVDAPQSLSSRLLHDPWQCVARKEHTIVWARFLSFRRRIVRCLSHFSIIFGKFATKRRRYGRQQFHPF